MAATSGEPNGSGGSGRCRQERPGRLHALSGSLQLVQCSVCWCLSALATGSAPVRSSAVLGSGLGRRLANRGVQPRLGPGGWVVDGGWRTGKRRATGRWG